MKLFRVFAAVGVLTLAATTALAESQPAKSKSEKSGRMDLSATLEVKERRVQEAFKNHDLPTFMSMVDANAWQIDPNGIMPVSAVPEMMKDVTVRSYTMENFKTVMIDPDACVATYVFNGDASYKGEPYPAGPWYCSTVWAKRGKEWKAVFHQETLSMQGMPMQTATH